MVIRPRIRAFLTALGLYVVAALFIGYFGVNAYTGKNGINARQELDQQIADLAVQHRLPGIHLFRAYAEAGLLLTYGPDPAAQYRGVATYIDKILKGARPADLPIQEPTQFELVINLKTAKALGLTIPQSVLGRADQVISVRGLTDRWADAVPDSWVKSG